MEGERCHLTSVCVGGALIVSQNLDSAASYALMPESTSLSALNSFPGTCIILPPAATCFSPQTNLPNDVRYVSVVVTWQDQNGIDRNTLTNINPNTLALAYGDGGDGIVTETSQNLSKVPGFAALSLNHTPLSVTLHDPVPSGCGNQLPNYLGAVSINEVHTCETSWPEVWDKVLRSVLGASDADPLIPEVTTGSSTRSGYQQTSISGLVYHPTKSVWVTCRYGTDQLLLPPPTGSTDINLGLFGPGTVHPVECIIPDSTLTGLGLTTLGTGQMQPIYVRLIATFTQLAP
ncbi:hypothetical protein GALL_503930 [mine drainage metagenome]|uniref:Uncharacterized protein n=1 Tax=mine drainage metagenome TaxID=410659 RepID=A0A1J5PKC9_9ZZZZ